MATSEPSQPAGSVTLDQFIALNDELAALVRAGVPLERGLIEAGRDLQGRLGALSTEMGRHLGEGKLLPEVIENSGGALPDVYRAVIEAGIRSGRLSRALEGMASIARGYAEARRAVGMALLYPLIVASLAYTLAVLFLTQITPRFVSASRSLGLPESGVLDCWNGSARPRFTGLRSLPSCWPSRLGGGSGRDARWRSTPAPPAPC